MNTRKLVILSAFLGTSVFLRLISIHIPAVGVELLRIGIAGIPIVLAGLMFGPVAGGIVGVLADVLGFWISPTGPFLPQFTIVSALNGILPPILLLNRRPPFSLPALIYSITVTRVITHVLLIPYFLSTILKAPYNVTLTAQLLYQAVSIPVYVIVIKALLLAFAQRASRIAAVPGK
ncbi:MAG: folate family ECF transporter S component [Chloroflexi bacterium]|nr:folate family ECF transporter S component [Chloroflexota bacterium]